MKQIRTIYKSGKLFLEYQKDDGKWWSCEFGSEQSHQILPRNHYLFDEVR